jgi:hypothetical protein
MGASCRPVLGLCLPLLLAGCAEFYDEIFLNADGSGTYRLTVVVRKEAAGEDLGMLRSSIRAKAQAIARESGFTLGTVEVTRDGVLLVVEATADFRDLSVFAHPGLSLSADFTRWSFVVPREASFRSGRFSARVLRGSAPPRDQSIRPMLRGREARFSVHFPGPVVETNGDRIERTANWVVPLETLCDRPVEMVAVSERGVPWTAVALGGAVALGLVVGTGVLLWRRRAA